jgi:phosphatidylinositol alpha-mannosyltransferase
LRRYVETNGLNDIVEFAGFVTDTDKPRYYAAADIAAFPSTGGESFGIVLLEAMANGRTAVLAGDNPGYRSVMESRSELLFAAADADVLAAKLKQLLANTQMRQADARWGEAQSRQFDVEVVGKQLETLYYRLCESKKLQ